MHKNLPPLLIFGVTAPSRSNAAAMTTQTALYFSAHAAVTIVISDSAPPPPTFQGCLTVIRERDLKNDSARYKNTKRLYILDDSHESLFALSMLRLAPGPWINADTTLHTLVHADFKRQAQWPDAYLTYMTTSLGEAGHHIAHSLTGDMRVSKVIASEITSFDALKSLGPQYPRANHTLDLALAPPSEKKSKETQETIDCFTIVTIGETDCQDARDTLEVMGHKVTLEEMGGGEPDLATVIEIADVVCFLDKAHRLPPAALTLALEHGKAMITASQPWVRHLPASTRLNIPHSQALHHLVAALGSLLKDSTVKPWLEDNTLWFWRNIETETQHSALADSILHTDVIPFAYEPPTRHPLETEPAKADEVPLPLGLEGQKRPFALIGAVPPKALLEQIFPAIDWAKSPKFATPSLAISLAILTRKPPSIILAILGYENMLVGPADIGPEEAETVAHMPPVLPWPTLQQRLKNHPEALTFDCSVEGLPRVRALTPQDTTVFGGLTLCFADEIHDDVKRQRPSGFIEQSATYWQLNPIEHRLDCLIISGVPGAYKLSVKTDTLSLMVVNDHTSAPMKEGVPAIVEANAQGVIQFSLLAIHPVNHYPLKFDHMLKKLATTPLYLEWCSHD